MPFGELLCRCSCNICACWPSFTFTNTAAVQTCLLVQCCCKMDACWTCHSISMPADLFLTQYFMSIGVVLPYLLYLLIWCLTISRACWYGISLSTVLAGVVLHYRSCFWFGTSLSAMHVGVVPHYRPCLLMWCLTVVMSSGVVPHY